MLHDKEQKVLILDELDIDSAIRQFICSCCPEYAIGYTIEPEARPQVIIARAKGSNTIAETNSESTTSEFPLRRNTINRFTSAETAIYNAVCEVEKMPPSTLLTDAVQLLQLARGKVADFVDSQK